MNADGSPVQSQVQFRLQVRSPGAEDCLLWEEQITKDLSSSSGVFVLSLNDGTGTRTDSGSFSFEKILSNSQILNLGVGKCTNGTAYTPGSKDGRVLVVSFRDQTMSDWEETPKQAINFTPKAIDALQVAGFPVESLLRFAESDGTLVNVSPLNNTQYNALLALIDGSSNAYVKMTSSGVTLPSVGSAPSSPSAGQIWFNSATKKLEFFDGITNQSLGVSGSGSGTVTSVTSANSDIGVATTTTTPVLTLNAGTTGGASDANKIPRLDSNGLLTSAMVPNMDAAKLTSGTLSIARGGTNSATALNNNRVMVSSGSAIVEASAITANRAIASDANGFPVHSSVTDTELGYLSGVTSAIQTQINSKTSSTGWTNYSVIGSDGSGNLTAYPGTTSGTIIQHSPTGPSWSSATYPSSTTANQLLYSSSNNVVGGLTTANNAILTTNGSGVPSWSALSGDAFSQYALLAGRSGGQTVYGGTAASNSLTLESTSHATKGNVIIAGAGGKVGIGMTNPGAPLHVQGTTTDSSADALRLSDSGANVIAGVQNNGTIYTDYGSGPYLFRGGRTDADAQINITNGDSSTARYPQINVTNFMGTAGSGSPGINLYNGRGNSSTTAAVQSGDVLGGVSFFGFKDTSWGTNKGASIFASATQTYSSSAAGTNITFHTTPNNSTTLQERVRIDQNGNVGIGTNSPAQSLHVVGLITGGSQTAKSNTLDMSYNASAGEVRFRLDTASSPVQLLIGKQSIVGTSDVFFQALPANSSGYGVLETWNGAGTVIGTGSTSNATPTPIIFRMNRSEQMRVHTNSNVGIGVTAPAYKLDVAGDINTSSCFRIGATTVSGTCTSDARLKENIQDYTKGLNDLIGVRLRTYQFNGLGGMPKTGEVAVGVIAQELEQTNPDLVKNKTVKMHPGDREEVEIKTVDYSKFTYMLINAVKELYRQLTEVKEMQVSQENQIAAKADERELEKLRSENHQLEERIRKTEEENLKMKKQLDKIEKLLSAK